jgi:ribosomal protein S18 acetylase RimI-like enzyme
MLIRPFSRADADAVVLLWTECGLVRPWNDPRKDIERKLTAQPELFLVVELDGAVAATVMAGYDGHRGWVNYLAVDPARRREGLGRALMAEVERLLTERGCPKLSMQIRAENSAVVDFYRGLGYGVDPVINMGKRLIVDEPPLSSSAAE